MASSPNAVVLRGGCLCEALSYCSTSLPDELTHCHCVTCRKISGAPFITWSEFPLSDFSWTSSKPSALRATWRSNVAERGHCVDCGSTMYMKYEAYPTIIFVAAGTIDEKSVEGNLPKRRLHIYAGKGKKAAWFDLPDDGIPRRDAMGPEFRRGIDEWEQGKRRSP
ncbi:MAG: hypothetical protein M1818_005383 [Claussenomyces sp. TS43310]|nr:MAG: hypothetical protein M1818_005383 [Claussenomyces sp. TS43310]